MEWLYKNSCDNCSLLAKYNDIKSTLKDAEYFV